MGSFQETRCNRTLLAGHMSAQRIEADLRACTDSFVNLVRAARIGDESAASKKRKVMASWNPHTFPHEVNSAKAALPV